MGAPLRGLSFYAADADRLARFYGRLLGWSRQTMPNLYGPLERPAVDPAPYNRMVSGVRGDVVLGIAPDILCPSFRPDRRRWRGAVVYFAVNDIAGAVRTTLELGGRVDIPATEIGDRGWICQLADPEGNPFGCWQAPAGWAGDDWALARDHDPIAGWRAPAGAARCPDDPVPVGWTAPLD